MQSTLAAMNPYTPPAAVPYSPGAYPTPYREPIPNAPTELVLAHLKATRPWVMMISVLCFFGAVLMCLAGLGMMVVGALSGLSSSTSAMPAWLGLIYLPFGLLYVYPGMKLWSYASAIGRLLQTQSLTDLEDALGQQKSFWKFCGIAVAVTLALYFVVLVCAMAFGVFASLGRHH
jgi:hypothetical protein